MAENSDLLDLDLKLDLDLAESKHGHEGDQYLTNFDWLNPNTAMNEVNTFQKQGAH